jgi:SAM-dependent methyltransferase
MWTDVVDLRDFYAGSLGAAAQRMIGRRIRAIWPDTKKQNVLGLGYATPFLNPYRAEATRVLAAMPARQGVLHWPAEGNGLTALCDEMDLPFPDLSMDRVLLVHALECAEQVRPMLREVWRVLSGSGRLLVVVPNRSGIWARFERTPFGHGQPYSPFQISRLLRENLFTPLQSYTALYIPPVHSRMILSAAPAWEKIGEKLFSTFSGVVLVEASKQLYAGNLQPAKQRRRVYIPAPQGNSPASRRS